MIRPRHLIAAAVIVAVTLLGAAALTDSADDAPTPTTYIVGPHGDNVTVAPRAAP